MNHLQPGLLMETALPMSEGELSTVKNADGSGSETLITANGSDPSW